MKFSQCHFKTTFYRLPLLNRGIYLQIIHVRRNAIFMFYRTASRALIISHLKLAILQDSELSHTKPENTVRFVTRLCITLF